MELKIKTLKIQNFKKVDNFELGFDKANWKIYGDNGVGKTTLFDAYIWLLFGKDSKDNTDFNVRKINQITKELQHNTEIMVEVALDIDGKELRLKKIQKEKWTKSRGSSELVLSGNTNEFYVNDVPTKESEYKAKVSSFCNSEKEFKLVSFLGFFNRLDKKEKRQMLFDLVKDITDEELANSVAFDLEAQKISLNQKEIVEDFKARIKEVGFENVRKIAKDSANKISKEIDSIPLIINEIYNSLTTEEAKEEIEKKLEEVDDKINQVSSEKAKSSNLQELVRLKNEKQERLNKAYSLKDELTRKISVEENDKAKQESIMFTIKQTKEQYQKNRETLIDKYNEIKSRKFEGATCPVCHREYPEEMKEQLFKDFEELNKKELADNITEGKRVSQAIATMQQDIEKCEENIKRCETEIASLKEQLKVISFDTIDIDEKVAKLSSGATESEYEAKLAALNAEKRALLEKVIRIENNEKSKQKIDELNNQIKEKQKAYGYYLIMQSLCDKFIEMKVNRLTESINKQFRITRFKLFNQALMVIMKKYVFHKYKELTMEALIVQCKRT